MGNEMGKIRVAFVRSFGSIKKFRAPIFREPLTQGRRPSRTVINELELGKDSDE